MSDLTDPVDPIHRDSEAAVRWIRGHVAVLRARAAAWEPFVPPPDYKEET